MPLLGSMQEAHVKPNRETIFSTTKPGLDIRSRIITQPTIGSPKWSEPNDMNRKRVPENGFFVFHELAIDVVL